MLIRIRSALFSVFFVLFVTVTGILCLPLLLFGRGIIRKTVQLWARITLAGLKWITGISYRIEGAQNIPEGGALIAANHQSMWETIALFMLMPKPAMIFKKELLHIPIYGWWARFSGNIAIDREGGAKALRSMTRKVKERVAAGDQVIVFPEGTRSPIGKRTAFKPGIAGLYAATKASCIPAAHDSGRYWRFPGSQKKPGVITLKILPAIAPGLDRKNFTRTLKAHIEAARPDLEGLS